MKRTLAGLAGLLIMLVVVAGAGASGLKACGYVRGWYVTANHDTSCPLARDVAVKAACCTRHPVGFSPVTGRSYRFDCYRSGHTFNYRRWSCTSYDGIGGPLKVVLRG
jgi:hypothetical protein